MKIIFLVLLIILVMVFTFIIGYKLGIRHMAKHIGEDLYFGDIIFDAKAENDHVISTRFSRSPRELPAYDYVSFSVKIRE